MAKLVAFYSRAGENYFSGSYRNVAVGNTEKVANVRLMLSMFLFWNKQL